MRRDRRDLVRKIRNRHMIHGNRYTEDLEYVLRSLENALRHINEKCTEYDKNGYPINTNEIGEIVTKALDINA